MNSRGGSPEQSQLCESSIVQPPFRSQGPRHKDGGRRRRRSRIQWPVPPPDPNTTGPAPLLPPDARSVLFVCLGNICRSPLAQGVFTHLAGERGVGGRFVIDSCGTGAWHVGSDADPRTLLVARKYQVPM
ncbi:MAG: hypothetical protein H7210_07840, partial [Pyrinomonadaceae bacterium]|nr:hypothetical protein [Phycisphaerales bacterium]